MTQSLPPKSLVLYADDDPDDQALIREIFSPFAGIIELVVFDNGARLLDFVEALQPLQPQPSLVILDMNMPLMNGLQTLNALRERPGFDEVPIVFFTTSTQPHEAARAARLRAGFVTKPLSADQIHQIVDGMLEYCNEDFKQKVNGLRGQ